MSPNLPYSVLQVELRKLRVRTAKLEQRVAADPELHGHVRRALLALELAEDRTATRLAGRALA